MNQMILKFSTLRNPWALSRVNRRISPPTLPESSSSILKYLIEYDTHHSVQTAPILKHMIVIYDGNIQGVFNNSNVSYLQWYCSTYNSHLNNLWDEQLQYFCRECPAEDGPDAFYVSTFQATTRTSDEVKNFKFINYAFSSVNPVVEIPNQVCTKYGRNCFKILESANIDWS